MKKHNTPRITPLEVELKLLLEPADIKKFLRHPLLKQYAAEAPHEQNIVNTYFDTPGLDLLRRGASLRVREIDGNLVQTLKAGDAAESGLHQRNEWEGHLTEPHIDPEALLALVGSDSQWSRLLQNPALTQRLAPMFTTSVQRTVWELRLDEGDEIECALDRGTIECKGRTEVIGEIELELKSGDPVRLFEFALRLGQTIPLRMGNASKAERGYAMVMPPQRPLAVKAAKLELSKRMTVEQGFKAVFSNCMRQIQANEAGVAAGDSESVHQMRVGIRRLRSALSLFKPTATLPQALLDELAWLASELGEARDWDVLSDSLSALNHATTENLKVDELQIAAGEVARTKREQASAAVRSPRYTELILSAAKWMQGAQWRAAIERQQVKVLEAPLKKFADKVLEHDQDRLLKRGKRLRGATPEARHRVRIAAKKTRYATEFFRSLYPAKRVQGYVKSLSALQDELGWLNDAAVADGLLHQIQQKHSALAPDAGFARGYLRSIVLGEDRELNRLWERFEPLKPPCRK